MNGPVLAPVTAVPGVIVAEGGPDLVMLNATSGQVLFSFSDSHKGSVFYGAASISHGVLYVGNFDGNFYAFGL